MKLMVQIPCFNEEATLPDTLRAIPREVAGVQQVEILVVDDGSTDGTAHVARRHGAYYVVRHTANQGLAAGISQGLIHDFDWEKSVVIRNESNQPVQIEHVVPSCSCMTPNLDRDDIPPRGTATLTVNGHQAELGAFTYNIAVQTTAREQPVIVIPVRGYLQPLVTVAQSTVSLESVTGLAPAFHKVPMTLYGNLTTAAVRPVVPPHAPFDVIPTTSQAGESFLRVQVDETASPGWYRHRVDVAAGNSNDMEPALRPVLNINVRIKPRLETAAFSQSDPQ